MSERALGRLLARKLGPRWVHTHHRDVQPGVPDYSYAVGGWLELKWRDAWPARAETPVTFARGQDRSWAAQRLFLLRRAAAGERCFVLCQVGRELLLFDALDASQLLEKATQAELRSVARLVTTGDWGRLLNILLGETNDHT